MKYIIVYETTSGLAYFQSLARCNIKSSPIRSNAYKFNILSNAQEMVNELNEGWYIETIKNEPLDDFMQYATTNSCKLSNEVYDLIRLYQQYKGELK